MNICRICTASTTNLTDLSSPIQENSTFSFLYYFNHCTNLEATLYDPLPNKACSTCIQDLINIIQFIKRAEASDKKLRAALLEKSDNEHQITGPGEDISIENVPIKLEIEENDYNISDAPQMDFTSTDFKAQELFKCEYCTITFTIDDLNHHMETCQREDIKESYPAKDETRKGKRKNNNQTIIEKLSFGNSRNNSSTAPSIRMDHLPETLPRGKDGKVQRKYCRKCYSLGTRKSTNFFCPNCKGFPGLCLGECFKEYHKQKKKRGRRRTLNN